MQSEVLQHSVSLLRLIAFHGNVVVDLLYRRFSGQMPIAFFRSHNVGA